MFFKQFTLPSFDLAAHIAHDKAWAEKRAKELYETEDDDCPACAGTGEGAYDGKSCTHCGGSGIAAPQLDYDD